jgi:hypothetical protein
LWRLPYDGPPLAYAAAIKNAINLSPPYLPERRETQASPKEKMNGSEQPEERRPHPYDVAALLIFLPAVIQANELVKKLVGFGRLVR